MRSPLATACVLLAGAGCGGASIANDQAPRPFSEHASGLCGKERWAVKTLTDQAAGEVNLTPQDSTVAQLDQLPAPSPEPVDRVPGSAEDQAYRVQATITFAKTEGDSDYHLVLTDAQGNTMIAESPSPDCTAGSRVQDRIGAVRQALDQRFPELAQGQVLKPNVAVTVDGVGFFDRVHGQTGVAPNGIELHPTTGLSFQGGG